MSNTQTNKQKLLQTKTPLGKKKQKQEDAIRGTAASAAGHGFSCSHRSLFTSKLPNRFHQQSWRCLRAGGIRFRPGDSRREKEKANFYVSSAVLHNGWGSHMDMCQHWLIFFIGTVIKKRQSLLKQIEHKVELLSSLNSLKEWNAMMKSITHLVFNWVKSNYQTVSANRRRVFLLCRNTILLWFD